MVGNMRPRAEVEDAVAPFIGYDEAAAFVEWLWTLLVAKAAEAGGPLNAPGSGGLAGAQRPEACVVDIRPTQPPAPWHHRAKLNYSQYNPRSRAAAPNAAVFGAPPSRQTTGARGSAADSSAGTSSRRRAGVPL
eukprot:TRINITY_DN9831_c0_g1_i1.p1 TRINITY_DN9831_c0_g1~~TRINITY_DN9831_c0_g1_i1.p1  ORF type:complete len:134 (+),score=37.62 TRINITY_DN9831_c0_g1_i1:257-658(+)